MASWKGSKPCTNCGRTSGTIYKCTNCGTLGCSNGNCGIGTISKSSHCKTCNKGTETIKI